MSGDRAIPASADDVLADGSMGVPEAAAFTGLSRSDLYDRMKRGELRFIKVGRRTLIPRRSLVALLRRHLSGA